jgi:hypothetical protein
MIVPYCFAFLKNVKALFTPGTQLKEAQKRDSYAPPASGGGKNSRSLG